MNRLLLISLLGVFLTLACTNPVSQMDTSNEKILDEKFDTYFSALNALGKFNGVIYVSQNGKKTIHKAYNLNEDKKHSMFVHKNSQFDIHSISKLMAKYLLLQLEQKGAINRADKLNSYSKDFPNGEQISIGMLLEHQSGLPRELSNFDGKLLDLDVEQTIALIRKEQLLFNPGEGLQYSNLAYQILYAIIGTLSNNTFEEFLKSDLFFPLKMDSSGAHYYTKEKNLYDLAASHEIDGDTILQIRNILEDEYKQARIYSNAADLMKFLDAVYKNPLASEMAKDSVIQHAGGSDGARAYVYSSLQYHTNFVLLANFDGIPFEKAVGDAISMIEGKPYTIPKAIHRKSIDLDSNTIQKYKGNYVFADMNNLELRFEIEGKHLVVFQEEEKTVLSAENETTFFDDPKAAESFEFIQNKDGVYDLLMGWKGVKLKGIKK